MSKTLRNGAVVTAFLAGVAGPALACGTTPCPTTPSNGGDTNVGVTVPVENKIGVTVPVTVPVENKIGVTVPVENKTAVTVEGDKINVQTGPQTATSKANATIAQGAVSTTYAPVTNYEADQATPLGGQSIYETQVVDKCLEAGDTRPVTVGLSVVAAGAVQFGIGSKKLDRKSDEYKECVARSEKNGRQGAMYTSGGLERYTVLKQWEAEDPTSLGVAMDATRAEVKKEPERQDPFFRALTRPVINVNFNTRVVDAQTATEPKGKHRQIQSINCGTRPTLYDPVKDTMYCGGDFIPRH